MLRLSKVFACYVAIDVDQCVKGTAQRIADSPEDNLYLSVALHFVGC